ncbi:shikimate dehydrogenase [Ruminiclostridium cellulolyticum]|uniref:Shikimate dehydrogenase (NADP(+)) n=1 Tax=Ruminiclostridium cellulolyticum (strain ATCC 35319 / DSM 5812 / JCM 6584 / H10) TaxID=394503 RepID=B8I7B9_RUMCH|nr:shikimate dehydrogenase [Ruminiclostridium cellulolyticum]ACL75043.1 shikimate 5-dehydrogenase [Ruminiclostridium cellulolyticum H10]
MNLIEVVNGKTQLYGVLGNPVQHTKSPFIHNTLFKEFEINAIYLPIHVDKGKLEQVMDGFRAIKFSGFNVTVPFKKDIINHLDEVSAEGKLMGAINTVINKDGRFIGYNTDAEGFVRDFSDGFETTFKGKRVMLLGAGGTSRAIAVRLASEGIEHLTIVNRTEANAQSISNLVNSNFGDIVSTILPEKEILDRELENNHIIVNTTPAGMSTYLDSTPFDLDFNFNGTQLVYDVLYVPKKTRFLEQAEKTGCKIRNGFGMLINQGVSAFEIWTGMQVGREQTNKLLKKIENIEVF